MASADMRVPSLALFQLYMLGVGHDDTKKKMRQKKRKILNGDSFVSISMQAFHHHPHYWHYACNQ